MARVRIPTQLRQLTEGKSEVDADGRTVGSLIDNLEATYPGLQERILQDGQLRRFVNVYVEDEDVRFLDGLGTPVPDGVVVSIIPAVAGG
jgi:molybdopterin converting factor small subunit